MCPLQIINDIEPQSSTLHCINAHCIHHPSNVKNYAIGHKSETDEPPHKKKLNWVTYVYTFLQILAEKLKIPFATENEQLFQHLDLLMTLSNSTWNKDKSAKFKWNINFSTEKFEMHPEML